MPAATTRYASRRWSPAFLAAALAAAGCAGNSLGAAYGYNSPPPPGFRTSGPFMAMGGASLDADSARLPVALRAASVLRGHEWPIIVADSASGVLISDWQYFEPAIPGAPATSACEAGFGLRLVVRPSGRGRTVRLAQEIAYSDQADRARAASYARLVFRDLYEEIRAAPDPLPDEVAPPPEPGAAAALTLRRGGDFRVCGWNVRMGRRPTPRPSLAAR